MTVTEAAHKRGYRKYHESMRDAVFFVFFKGVKQNNMRQEAKKKTKRRRKGIKIRK